MWRTPTVAFLPLDLEQLEWHDAGSTGRGDEGGLVSSQPTSRSSASSAAGLLLLAFLRPPAGDMLGQAARGAARVGALLATFRRNRHKKVE